MYCSKCGTQNKDTARFCKNCGEPLDVPVVSQPVKNADSAGAEGPEKSGRRAGEAPGKKASGINRNNIKWICIAVGILIIAAVIAFSFMSKDKKEKERYDNYLTSADKYLEEMDYENAEDAYLNAIKIDPKKEEPYLGLADLYVLQGDYKKADKILIKAEEVIYGKIDDESEGSAEKDSESEQSAISKKRQELADKAAAQAYYDLLMEYQDTYGNARKVTIDTYWKYLEGLAFAKLIDFDGDGRDELVVAYADPAKELDFIARYSIEVWQYKDYELQNMFSGEGYGNDGATTTLYITSVEDQYYLIEGSADDFEYDYFWGFQDGDFKQVRSLEIDYGLYPEINARIDGEMVSEAEFNAEQGKWWANCQTYGLSRVEEDEDVSLAELQNTLDILREILGIQNADEEPAKKQTEAKVKDITPEEMATSITDHYNELADNDGTYVVFMEESVESDLEYQVCLRYQMSDEEAEEILARGGTPSANKLVGMVTVNKVTGEVTTDWGDTWNMW